MIARH